jgi:polyphosphate kinase 2 (PPK2 family)
MMPSMAATEWDRWFLVPGESKKYARVFVIEAVIAEVKRAMLEHAMAPIELTTPA